MTNYEMIVLDLDGTLTNRDKVITPRTKQALMSAQEQGKIVVLASGRPTDVYKRQMLLEMNCRCPRRLKR